MPFSYHVGCDMYKERDFIYMFILEYDYTTTKNSPSTTKLSLSSSNTIGE